VADKIVWSDFEQMSEANLALPRVKYMDVRNNARLERVLNTFKFSYNYRNTL
jgi:hypothetical protein